MAASGFVGPSALMVSYVALQVVCWTVHDGLQQYLFEQVRIF